MNKANTFLLVGGWVGGLVGGWLSPRSHYGWATHPIQVNSVLFQCHSDCVRNESFHLSYELCVGAESKLISVRSSSNAASISNQRHFEIVSTSLRGSRSTTTHDNCKQITHTRTRIWGHATEALAKTANKMANRNVRTQIISCDHQFSIEWLLNNPTYPSPNSKQTHWNRCQSAHPLKLITMHANQ